MSETHHLAQLNIATMREALDSPAMADFVANLDRINAVADAAPGFVWRLEGDPPVNPFGSMTLVNLSVWRDATSLSDYVHKSAHVEILRRRREWFSPLPEASMVLWWVPTGHTPSVHEAAERLELLRRKGSHPAAFTFAARHDPPGPATRPSASAVNACSSFSEVAELIAEFEAQRLPKDRWTHEAHVAAGLWYLWHLGLEAALPELRLRITRHNESVGTLNNDSSGYHESITRLYLLGISCETANVSQAGFDVTLRRILSSPLISRNWPLSYYSKERLFSAEARREWCEPDLQPAPVPANP